MSARALILLCLLPLLAAPLAAAPDTPAKQRAAVHRLIQPVIDHDEVVGLSVGVLQADGRAWFRGYGKRSATDRVRPSERDVFEIGSISKVFTGALLADAVARGEVKLGDPVTRYLPDVKIHANGRPITLLDLATHTSGLPRMPTNFAPQNARNPFADYEAKQLYAFLRDVQLSRPPGNKYEYSNVGMGLLGHVLARVAKQPTYAALLRARLTGPLALRDTAVAFSEAMKARVVPGHDGSGNPAENWDIPLLAGAGGIRSTAADMLALLRACLSSDARMAQAFRAATKPRHTVNPNLSIGLAWHLFTKRGVVWHNGQTGGYHCFAGYDPQRKVAVVLLGNTANPVITRLGRRVIAALQGRAAKPLKLFRPVPLTAKQLQRCVGRYDLLGTGLKVTVTRKGTRLFAKVPGQPSARLLPESALAFRVKGTPGKLTFQLDDQGQVKGFRLKIGGRVLRGRRLP